MSSQRLADRVAFVTGASSGIGNAIAAAYGREGATVVVADVRREPKLEAERSVFDKLEEIGVESTFIETDVSDESSVEGAIEETIDTYGGLDVLVNNAGIYHQNPAHEAPVSEWDQILDVNLRGIFLGTKYAIPALRSSESGKVVNVASIHGLLGAPTSAAYCASKGGVVNLTKQLAIDYADDEINVNALAPGVIKTAQNAEWRESDPELVEEWHRSTPWPRFGEPEHVADAAVFLASEESEFVTGHVLVVDGGWTAI